MGSVWGQYGVIMGMWVQWGTVGGQNGDRMGTVGVSMGQWGDRMGMGGTEWGCGDNRGQNGDRMEP